MITTTATKSLIKLLYVVLLLHTKVVLVRTMLVVSSVFVLSMVQLDQVRVHLYLYVPTLEQYRWWIAPHTPIRSDAGFLTHALIAVMA